VVPELEEQDGEANDEDDEVDRDDYDEPDDEYDEAEDEEQPDEADGVVVGARFSLTPKMRDEFCIAAVRACGWSAGGRVDARARAGAPVPQVHCAPPLVAPAVARAQDVGEDFVAARDDRGRARRAAGGAARHQGESVCAVQGRRKGGGARLAAGARRDAHVCVQRLSSRHAPALPVRFHCRDGAPDGRRGARRARRARAQRALHGVARQCAAARAVGAIYARVRLRARRGHRQLARDAVPHRAARSTARHLQLASDCNRAALCDQA
jgi:hypothetical protein